LIVLVAMVIAALLAPVIAPYGFYETKVGSSLVGPSLSHPMGTDQFGRDVLSRVLGGARISLGVGISAAAAAALIGGLLGALAATLRGWKDELIMRAMDGILAFPGILLAIVIGVVLGGGVGTLILALTVLYVPGFARVARSLVLRELEEDYVTAARLIGTRELQVVGYHVGINAVIPLLVFLTTIVADAILLEASLAFVGVGVPPPAPSWGNIISQGQQFIFNGAWWLTTFPGLAICVTVITLNGVANYLARRFDAAEVRRG
jgi:peptide/nickel transport system permease protein